MSDTNTTDLNTTPATPATDTTLPATDEATPAKLYATRAECEGSSKPSDAKGWKVFEAAKAGATVGYLWARGYDHALATVARLEGFTVSTGNGPVVTKETIASRLAEFTDAELQALGLTRKPVKVKK